jgi:hypothetical protein
VVQQQEVVKLEEGLRRAKARLSGA